MSLAQSAPLSIIHDKIRDVSSGLDAEIQHTDNVRMHELSNDTRFPGEIAGAFRCQLCMEYFDGCLRAKVDVFAQVDLSEPPAPEQLGEMIVAEVLSYIVLHRYLFSNILH